MIDAPQFDTLQEMDSSSWLVDIKNEFDKDQWPAECDRCKKTELINGTSVRLHSIEVHDQEIQRNYLQVGGVLDNVCNSACQMCSANVSTKIGKLISKTYPKTTNVSRFRALPQDRILHLDINGGEPSASKNYKDLLQNLPPNLKTLRVNTNAAIMLPVLEEINDRGIKVTVTVSFDGIGAVHDYVRWPIPWNKFCKNLLEYKSYRLHNLNFWTTVNTLNVNDLENIFDFTATHGLDHSYALLARPDEFDISYTNRLTLRARDKFRCSTDLRFIALSKVIAVDSDNQSKFDAFVAYQDKLRGINMSNFIK